jgi:hypothetical protein
VFTFNRIRNLGDIRRIFVWHDGTGRRERRLTFGTCRGHVNLFI